MSHNESRKEPNAKMSGAMISGGYTGFWGALFDFQQLLSGLAAVAAAIVGGVVLYTTARLPINSAERQAAELRNRRRRAVSVMLSSDFKRLSELARQAEGMIVTTIAANINVSEELRSKIRLHTPPLVLSWEDISLFDFKLMNEIYDVKRKIDQYNFDVDRAGGVFGDDNFKKWMKDQIKALAGSSQRISGIIAHVGQQD